VTLVTDTSVVNNFDEKVPNLFACGRNELQFPRSHVLSEFLHEGQKSETFVSQVAPGSSIRQKHLNEKIYSIGTLLKSKLFQYMFYGPEGKFISEYEILLLYNSECVRMVRGVWNVFQERCYL
jgi:hypothetical protein